MADRPMGLSDAFFLGVLFGALTVLALILLSATSTPTHAAQCDRFRYWAYNWPQPCHQRLNFYLAHHAAVQRHAAYRVAARVSVLPTPLASAPSIAPADLDKLRSAMMGAGK